MPALIELGLDVGAAIRSGHEVHAMRDVWGPGTVTVVGDFHLSRLYSRVLGRGTRTTSGEHAVRGGLTILAGEKVG